MIDNTLIQFLCPCCNCIMTEDFIGYSEKRKFYKCDEKDHKILYNTIYNKIDTITLSNDSVGIRWVIDTQTIWIGKINNPFICSPINIEKDLKNYKNIFFKVENILF